MKNAAGLEMDMSSDEAPDWMPQASALNLPEGHRRFSSVGQLWQVRDGQWVRIRKPAVVDNSTLSDHHSRGQNDAR